MTSSYSSRCYIGHWQLHHYWSLHQEVHQLAYTSDVIWDTNNSITTNHYTKRSISQHTHQMLYGTLTTPSLLITTPRGPSASIHIRCYIGHWQLHHCWSLHQEVHQPAYTSDVIWDTDNSITTDHYTKRSISQHTHQMLYGTLTTPSLLITTPRGPSTSIHIHNINSFQNTTILYYYYCTMSFALVKDL